MRKSRISSSVDKSRVIPVPPGISVLRYASAGDPVAPPTITVAPVDPFSKIELIAAPGAASHTLSAPGMVLVIRSETAAELSMIVRPAPGGHSAAAELKLERLVSADIPIKQIPSLLQPAKVEKPGKFQVLAHVAGRGDIVVPDGGWIAGPELPSQVEGIELQWPGKPAGIELEYAVTVGTRPARRLPLRHTGEFAGTRGRGIPITAFAVSLRGANTQNLSLQLEGLFLGAPLISKKGRELVLTGPTGREPLVGLRMSLIGARTAAEKSDSTEPARPTRSKDRVQIFRGPRAKAA